MVRQVQTLVVSVAVHVAALFVLVVIPLLAMDALPGVPTSLEYRFVDIVLPRTPPAPSPAVAARASAVATGGVPTEAPTGVTAERPQPAIGDLTVAPGGIGVPGGMAAPPDAVIAPPPQPPPSDPVRPGGKIQAPVRIVNVAPVYPAIALAARVEGTVILEAIIGVDGGVREARVLRSIPLLDAAAVAAVRQWRYTPTTLNGIPVPVVMTVTVRFEIAK